MIEQLIAHEVARAIRVLYGSELESDKIQIQETRKDFSGDKTVVVFPFLRDSKKNPVETGNDLGAYLVDNLNEITGYNVVKGFLNLEISDNYWLTQFIEALNQKDFGHQKNTTGRTIMVEYSSPNTNKPLHLGHIRNNLLGYSVSEILKANGHKVLKTQIINDRGIHICKSMLAWQNWGGGSTPETANMKGDKFVGQYYVDFDKHYKKQVQSLVSEGIKEDDAKKQAPLIVEAQELLRKWEAREEDTYLLWEKMNNWVYAGFDVTYNRMGVDFDKLYYESQTYLKGRDYVNSGLGDGKFIKKEDGSIWCDLTAEGLDQKLLIRSDGTTVYMTQDIGTAIQRQEDYEGLSQIVYTVANEQDYHFQVLFLILDKLGFTWAKDCYHLSYGMVDLPSGKMKSREGTVVDADDLMQELVDTAKSMAEELGKLDDVSEENKEDLYEMIGIGALKYFMLKVDPKKRMLFDPKESIDFTGNTGPFIQYTHARINSILRKAEGTPQVFGNEISLTETERNIIKSLLNYPSIVQEAGKNYSPANIANYVYELVKEFNQFYQNTPILKADNEELIGFRLSLSKLTAEIIKRALTLLGIKAPNRM